MTMRAKPTRLDVRHAQSVAFMGSANYLSAVSGMGWSGGRYTVCAWVKVDVYTGVPFQTIFSIIDGAGSPGLWYEEPFTEIYVYDGFSTSGFFPTLLIRGLPLWIAMTNDGTNLRAWARKDGQRQMVNTANIPGTTEPIEEIRFGNDTVNEYLGGRMWGAKIWKEALSRGELLRESLAPHPVRTRDLHGWYPMEGRRFHEDRSGLGHHLTIGGTPRLAKPFLGPVYVEPERIWAEPPGGGGGGGDPDAAKRGYFFG